MGRPGARVRRAVGRTIGALRRAACRATYPRYPFEQEEHRGHVWGHPKADADDPGVMVSECLRQCGAVRRLRLDVPNRVRVVHRHADPKKTQMRNPRAEGYLDLLRRIRRIG